MKRTLTVSDHVDVAAEPDAVYALLSDPTQVHRWSPENTGAVVENPRRGGAYEGMTFVGRNKRGRATWSTRCVVTAAEPSGIPSDVKLSFGAPERNPLAETCRAERLLPDSV